MPYATYVDRSVLSKLGYKPAANMINLPNKDQNEDKLAIYLPRELMSRLQEQEATSEASSLSSTVVELLEKHLPPNQLSDQSFESGGTGSPSTAASSTTITSMYDAEDEPCEVMTSFLEHK